MKKKINRRVGEMKPPPCLSLLRLLPRFGDACIATFLGRSTATLIADLWRRVVVVSIR